MRESVYESKSWDVIEQRQIKVQNKGQIYRKQNDEGWIIDFELENSGVLILTAELERVLKNDKFLDVEKWHQGGTMRHFNCTIKKPLPWYKSIYMYIVKY